jgi:hypothetical protein
MILALPLPPLMPILDVVLKRLEIPHDLLVKETIIAFDLSITLLLEHVLFLGEANRTFLLSLRRF